MKLIFCAHARESRLLIDSDSHISLNPHDRERLFPIYRWQFGRGCLSIIVVAK